MTCAKTQGFLAKHKVSVGEQADAKKATIKGAAALGVLDGIDELYVAKGKNQVNRIESTLPVDLVPGAVDPDRRNGRIASYIPARRASPIQALVALTSE